MSDLCRLIWCALIGLFRSRAALEAEVLVLRHQLNVLRRKSPKRVALNSIERLLLVGLYRLVPGVLDECSADISRHSLSVSCFGFAVGRGLQYFRDATKISDHDYTDSAWPSRLGCLCRSPGVISAAIVDTMDEAVKMLPRMIALDRHAVRRRKSGKALDLRGDR